MNTPHVTLWADPAAPTESALRRLFADEGLHPYAWSNGAHDTSAAHSHAYDKVIYVVRGSITFGLPELNQSFELHAGDRLDLPAEVAHNAQVGAQGVVCLEGHKG
ncbi:MAG: cupin [Anaerolineales bacterium]|nr:cupin [Anaerolineales bacterium]